MVSTLMTPNKIESDEEVIQEDQFQNSTDLPVIFTANEQRRVSIEDPNISQHKLKEDGPVRSKRSSEFLNKDRKKSQNDESIFRKVFISSAIVFKAKVCTSENIGVLNMKLDIPHPEPLPPFETAAISCVLQKFLNILKILEYTIPAKIDKRWDESYESMIEKHHDLDETEHIFREDMGFLPLIPTADEKLQRDRTYLYKLYEEILDDIKKYKRWNRLEIEVDNITKTIENERALRVDYEIWSDLVNKLKDIVDSQKLNNQKEAEDSIETARKEEIEVDNSIFLNGSRLDYVKRWEEDRLNQQRIQKTQEEEKIINELKKTGYMETAEHIVAEDLDTFLKDDIVALDKKLEEWTNKYNVDFEKKEIEIRDLKEAIDEQKENLQEMYSLYDERQAFIDEYCAEEARIKKEAEYQKTISKAATIIQSLWRGYMVKHLLGEYQGLWARLRKRKKLAAKARKKREAWQKKKAKQWGESKLKTMKNIVDPDA